MTHRPVSITTLVSCASLLATAVATSAQTVIHVDAAASGTGDGTTWIDAYGNLQDALDAAVPPSQIWVARGTYKPDQGATHASGDRFATFQLIDDVQLYGGFLGTAGPSGGETSLGERDWQVNVTVLSGDLSGDDVSNLSDFFSCFNFEGAPYPEGCEALDAGADGYIRDVDANMDDNSFHVVTGSDTSETAVLDGFTITGGSAFGGGDTFTYRGGGMFTILGHPSVANCRFTGNIAHFVGGGMYNESSFLRVINCVFDGNFARYGAGMRNIEWGYPTIVGCTFRGNVAGEFGGAMDNFRHANPIIRDCTFIGNSARHAGAISNGVFSLPTFFRCVFASNVAEGFAGAVYNGFPLCDATFVNTVFSGNLAGESGGAMYNYTSNPKVANCLFNGNAAGLTGGAMANYSRYLGNNGTVLPIITNSSFSGNYAGEFGGAIANRDNSVATLTNSILWGNVAALGANEIYNENTDPELPTGSAIFRYSDIAGSGGSAGWDTSLGVDEGGNIDADPLFSRMPSDGGDGWGDDPSTLDVDESLNDDFGDLRLGAGSPAIDAGDNIGVPPDILDVDDDGDSAEALPFDLAGFPRFDNDGSVIDSGLPGNGHLSIVDMGAYEADKPKNRFITFVIPALPAASDAAIRVELVSLLRPDDDPDALSFADFEGELRYVNRIRDDEGNIVTDCPDSETLGTSYPCATLGCQPEYADWSGLLANRAIHVTGDAIVPSSRYHVAIIPRICAADEAACPVASTDLVVTTGVWGNLQGSGVPNVIQVALVVDKVKDLRVQLPEYRTMLQPETPLPYRRSTNVLDITLTVDALKGFAYPFDGPSGCP